MAPKSMMKRGAPSRRKAERDTAKKSNKHLPVVEDEYDSDAMHEDEDEAGISEQGLERIMRALGPDGLNEMDVAALKSIQGVDEDEEADEDEDEEEEEVGEDEDEDEEEDEDVDVDVDDDDDDDKEDENEDFDDDDEEDVDYDNKSDVVSVPKDSLAASILRSGLVPEHDDDDEDEDEGDDEDGDEDESEEIDVEALPEHFELSEDTRAARHNRVRINRTEALERIYDDFRLGHSSSAESTMPWIETMVVTYPKKIADEVPDVQNDLERELTFYRQALDGAVRGRELVLAADLPFSRPADYFAEMVKTDEHMERVRQRLLDESAGIKASEEAKRQRELKKFGKEIQTTKTFERQKSKRDMLEKVNSLKRKRGGGLDKDDDEFNVQLEEAIGNRRTAHGKTQGHPKMSRTKRNERYGFGGKKRHLKSNTAEGLNDPGAARSRRPGARPKASKAKRPGKSKRASTRK
ncbi:rRNA-processing protein EBP2 [Malassezia vespertilionis]|uniref:Ebp2p n=1 Tax=Malassezia vespertilionis TaxID=2020962 RepID=A0A2N1J877_9BASI|nr:rRNA-processing protein EBP2 [Malassezia vespertilionis]PKI82672.1 Ebp2p [Malassezia vespertilionis]WFD08527.1 rRNA-processing protein EBP2 [Malassezia vespertilionis]